jgi:hypothetical protein
MEESVHFAQSKVEPPYHGILLVVVENFLSRDRENVEFFPVTREEIVGRTYESRYKLQELFLVEVGNNVNDIEKLKKLGFF